MLLNTHDSVNSWSGTVGNIQLNMSAGSVTLVGGTMSIVAPTLSEPQSTWYNSTWWKSPTYDIPVAGTDTPWFKEAVNYSLLLKSGSIDLVGGTMTLGETTNTTTLDMTAATVTLAVGMMTSSVPLSMTKAKVFVGGGGMTIEIEYSSEKFLISNSSTFDGLGISIGVDVALNTSDGKGYKILQRVDIDTLRLDGIFGTPPQPYKIVKNIHEMEGQTMTTFEFDGDRWHLVSETKLGL
jgi:hypothetical protein